MSPETQTTQPKRRYLTVNEAAEALSTHKQTIYDAVSRGEIEAVRIGRLVRITDRKILDLAGIAA